MAKILNTTQRERLDTDMMQHRHVALEPVPAGPTGPDRVDDHVFLDVLDLTCRSLEEDGIPYGLMGGLASAVMGRPRWTHDIDVFVRPQDAHRTLVSLARRGMSTEETNPHWIFKARRDGVLVDVIFRAKGDIYLDDEMQSRLLRTSFSGRPVRTIPPEDLIVIKAIIHDEETPRHWFDAISVIAGQGANIDWDYLVRRASCGPRRVLSLLLYAQSNDVLVPDAPIQQLYGTVFTDGDAA